MRRPKRLRLIRRKRFVSRGRKGCVKLAWQREWQVVMKEASKKLQDAFIRWSEYFNLYVHMYIKGTFRDLLPFLQSIIETYHKSCYYSPFYSVSEYWRWHILMPHTLIQYTNMSHHVITRHWLHKQDKLHTFILTLPQPHVFEKYSPAVLVGQMPPGVDWLRLCINMSLPQLQTASGLYILIVGSKKNLHL